jgi:hypothetical protein
LDFTINTYRSLLKALLERNYQFQTFKDFLIKPKKKVIILRHDVDTSKENSLQFAEIQNELGIVGTYYFRTVPDSYDQGVINQITELGHEIGYHYETMDSCNGDVDKAYNEFCLNLEMFRKLYPVTTVCMHGSPRSKFDNKDIFRKYDYKSLDIIGEPYYDIDFDEVFYLTDTGRRWDGWRYSIRDKIPQQQKWINEGLIYHSTQDIVNAIENENFPEQVMFTFHPQRWHERPIPWIEELVLQNSKNFVKYFIVSNSKNKMSSNNKLK